MFSFEHNLFIDCPQQEVFDFATNPANDIHWRDSAVLAEWISPEPHAVGSTQRLVDKFMGREIESTAEITAWDPPHVFGQKAYGGPVQFSFTMTLEAVDGGTQIDISGQAEFGGMFKMAEGLLRKQLINLISAEFDTLKQVMETG